MDRKEALRRVLFLKGVHEDAICAIATAGVERRLGKGEVLFSEHDRCQGLLVVLTGAVKVYKLDARGRELTLGWETPGMSVAEIALFDGGNYPANAESGEDNTTVLVVPRERFQYIMASHPQIAELAVRTLSIRIRKLLQIVEAQSMHTVRARLADYLMQAAVGQPTVVLDQTNDAIASEIGTVREVVSRTLRALKDAGMIELHGRSVTLTQPEALQRLAGNLDTY